MNRIKSILTIFLTVLISFHSISIPVSAHWADNEIRQLIEKNIIQSENIRPDDPILRGEFVKIVNRTFGFTQRATEGFTDVSNQAWYYEDFLIAKKQGYIKGDDQGRANPDKPLTRGEVSVILYRLIDIENVTGTQNFTDIASIPNWAIDAVSALSKVGFIKGYPDGSFRPGNTITRAEAFALMVRTTKKDEPGSLENTVVNPTPQIIGGGSGGSGGSSGGGGNPSGPVKLNTPEIVRFKESENTLEWYSVQNANQYIIFVTGETANEPITVYAKASSGRTNQLDLSEAIETISRTTPESQVHFSIMMKCVASGYLESNLSTPYQGKKVYSGLPLPKLNKTLGSLNQISRGAVTWDSIAGSKSYQVTMLVGKDKKISNQFEYLPQDNRVIIPNLHALEGPVLVQVKAISEDALVVRNSQVSTIEVKGTKEKGTSLEDPILIYSKEDFEQIRRNPDRHFRMMNDLSLGEIEPIDSFNGTITTLNNTFMAIEATLKGGEKETGLFRTLSGGIKNLVLKGTVAGNGSSTGGFAGSVSGVIENCVNLAQIDGLSYVGGIAGKSTGTIRQCYNFGKVTASQYYAGGICGMPSGGSVLEQCGNHGTVRGGQPFGGIAGYAYTSITNSYNVGDVGSGGGIAGRTRSASNLIRGCYNLGNAQFGIIARYNSAGEGTVERCYHGGEAVFPIMGNDTPGNVSGTIYVNDEFEEDNVPSGTEPVTLNMLKGLEPLVEEPEKRGYAGSQYLKGLLANEFEYVEGYDYPQIRNNKEFILENLQTYPSPTNLSETISGSDLVLNWNLPDREDMKGVMVKAIDNYTLKTVFEMELPAESTSCIMNGLVNGSFYQFEVNILYESGVTSKNTWESKIEGLENVPGKLNTPWVTYLDTEETIEWAEVQNADSYLVKVHAGNLERIRNIGEGNTLVLTDTINELSSLIPDGEISFTIWVIACHSEGKYLDSNSSLPLTITKYYNGLEMPELTKQFAVINGEESVSISWNPIENASSYLVQVFSKDILLPESAYQYQVSENRVIIKELDLQKAQLKISVKALSNDLNTYKHSPTSSLELKSSLGTGTKEDPIRIYHGTQFEKIAEEPTLFYLLMNDIVLEDYLPISNFSGELKAQPDTYASITVNLSSETTGMSLFQILSGHVEGIILKGSIKGTGNTAGFAGKLSGTGKIENCINLATIIGTTNTGGFVATADSGASMIRCYNFASVTGTSGVGGIAGYPNDGGKTKIIIDLCGNYGTITGTSNVGGIAGACYTSVSNSYNVGKVTGGGVAGMIRLNTDVIKNSYNAGVVNQGILTRSFSAGSGKIESSFNYYDKVASQAYLVGSYFPAVTQSIYLQNELKSSAAGGSPITAALFAGEKAPITDTNDLEYAGSTILNSLLNGTFERVAGSPYPQIKGNHEFSIDEIQILNGVSELVLDEDSLTWKIPETTYSPIQSQTISVIDLDQIQVIFKQQLTSDQESIQIENIAGVSNYQIMIEVVYENGCVLTTTLENLI